MRVIIQRINRAKIVINKEIERQISRGFLIFIGVHVDDEEEDARLLAEKIANLRIFRDENGKLNRSLLDIDGEALVVSNFTLFSDCSHGRRPSYLESAKAGKAEPLYHRFVELLSSMGIKRVVTGEFGADMDIECENQGPVNIIIDSPDIRHRKRYS